MEQERTKLHIESNIAHLELNRPEKSNAFDLAMFKSIDQKLRYLHQDRSLRVVIVSAIGDDFSTGLDIKALMNNPRGLFQVGRKLTPGMANLAQRMCTGWQKIPIPVIMALHGRCWGAGLQLALGADLRIASKTCSLSIMETKWGLLPDMGGSLVLPSIVPRDLAFKWTVLAELIDAEEALRGHLVTEVTDNPLATAKQLALQIANQSPDAVAAVKRLYQSAWLQKPKKQLAREFLSQIRLLLGKNRKIAVRNNTGKESKPFQNRGKW